MKKLIILLLWVSAISAQEKVLPTVMAKWQGGELTSKEYRSVLKKKVIANPAMFGITQEFLVYKMFEKERQRLSIIEPDDITVGAFIVSQERSAGSKAAFDAQLKRVGVSRYDLHRSAGLSLMYDAVIRKLGKKKEGEAISRMDRKMVMTDMQRRYRPEMRNISAPVIAKVGGRNLSIDDALDYVIKYGRDRLLFGVLHNEVTEGVLRIEAINRGIAIADLDSKKIIEAMLSVYLKEGTLKAYYLTRRKDFAIYKTAHILCANSSAAGLKRGSLIYDKLKAGKIKFAEAAKDFSDCSSASRGGYIGYVAQSFAVARGLKPSAYMLDTQRTASGDKSPLTLPYDNAVLKALQSLKDGEYSKPIKVNRGYALIKRIETRYPQNAPGAIMPFLKSCVMAQKHAEIMKSLKGKYKISFKWTPQKRMR